MFLLRRLKNVLGEFVEFEVHVHGDVTDELKQPSRTLAKQTFTGVVAHVAQTPHLLGRERLFRLVDGSQQHHLTIDEFMLLFQHLRVIILAHKVQIRSPTHARAA